MTANDWLGVITTIGTFGLVFALIIAVVVICVKAK